MSEWISVEERLPDHYETVLVTDGDIVALGSMNKIFGLSVCHTGYQEMFGHNLTHWRHLPEPPK